LEAAVIPVLQTVAPATTWTTVLTWEVDFNSFVFHMIPASNLDLTFKWNNALLVRVFHANNIASPLHFGLSLPALMASSIEIGVPKMVANIGDPIGEATMAIAYLTYKSIIEIVPNKNTLKIHIPLVEDPVVTLAWQTTDVLKNQLHVLTRVPHYMSITDITMDWKCQSIISCAVKTDAALTLPVVGESHLNTFNTMILGTTKSQLSMKASSTHTNGLIAFVPPVEVSISWVNNKLINNQIAASLKSTTLGNIVDATIEGKCKSLMKCSYRSEVSGAMPSVGKYNVSNSLSYLLRLADTKLASSTSATFSGGLLSALPPVKHSLTAQCDFTTLTLDASSSTSVWGTTVGLALTDSRNVQILY